MQDGGRRSRFGWIAILWLLLPLTSSAQPATSAPELRFERAEFVISDSATPPQSGWQRQTLPDSWRHNHPGLVGFAWYRMQFDLDAVPPQAMALFVGRVSLRGQFWLNGLVLNPDVDLTQLSRLGGNDMGRWPQLITLPAGLLRTRGNVLYIRLEGNNLGGRGLWDVRIGPIERLRAPWLVREIPQRIIPQALFVLMAAGCVFVLLVWWRERRAGNLHFMGVMVLWTVIVGMWVIPEPLLSRVASSMVLSTLYIAFYWTLLALFYHYSESEWRWYPPVLHIVSGLALLLALGIHLHFDSPDGPLEMALVLSLTALLRVLATAMLVQSAWRKRSPRAYALAATEVLWFAGHVQLIGIIGGWLPPEPFRLDPAGSLPLYLVLLYFFVDRLVRERDQAIREQQVAVDRERSRILQDMHDGMGSQLITALRLAKREGTDPAVVARGIEEALQDLRLVIDSLDVGDQGLVPLLGNLRYRLEPQLAALGIRLNWEVQTLPELDSLSPQSALGVLRIVQEALNNAVKHAQAKVIAVSITRHANSAVIAVADDGIGFDSDAAVGPGRGLSSLRKRAEQLGATLHVERRAGGGTVVSLDLSFTSGTKLQPALA